MTAIYGVSHDKSTDLNASDLSLAKIQSSEDVASNRLNSIEIVFLKKRAEHTKNEK